MSTSLECVVGLATHNEFKDGACEAVLRGGGLSPELAVLEVLFFHIRRLVCLLRIRYYTLSSPLHSQNIYLQTADWPKCSSCCDRVRGGGPADENIQLPAPPAGLIGPTSGIHLLYVDQKKENSQGFGAAAIYFLRKLKPERTEPVAYGFISTRSSADHFSRPVRRHRKTDCSHWPLSKSISKN